MINEKNVRKTGAAASSVGTPLQQEQQQMIAPAKVEMSPEEFSQLQRDIQLNARNPDYVLPDGRTNQQVWDEIRERDADDRQAASEFDERSHEANTERIERVAVMVTPEGHLHSSTTAVIPAETSEVREEVSPPLPVAVEAVSAQERSVMLPAPAPQTSTQTTPQQEGSVPTIET